MTAPNDNEIGWLDHVRQLSTQMARLSCRDRAGRELGADNGFARWTAMTRALRQARATVYLAGNGASAALASHMAADLAKNAGVRTETFTDPALVTAVANDLGYDQVFAAPLRHRARPTDMLVLISSSGASPNCLVAANTALDLGVTVVTLTAMSGTNPLRRRGDLNFHLCAATYGDAESTHAAVLHHWMDRVAATAKPCPAPASPLIPN